MAQKQPLTEFGKMVRMFCISEDMQLNELAEKSGVLYDTLLKVMHGRRPGYETVEQVSRYIAACRGGENDA